MFLIKKLYNSTIWSLSGLAFAFKNELAFRIELVVVLLLTPVAFYVATDLNQLLWLLVSLHQVLIVELINTAIESTVNRIGTDLHILAKHAKDVASAAVFYSVMLALVVWTIVMYSIW